MLRSPALFQLIDSERMPLENPGANLPPARDRQPHAASELQRSSRNGAICQSSEYPLGSSAKMWEDGL
jgi:hypothetical protein